MRKYLWTLILVVAVIGLCAWNIYPPQKQLRLGKDLRGGVSLIYSVQLRSGDSPTDIISQMITVLKRRVDPDGLMEITMVQQGQDRIEITMPLPGDEVKKARKAFEDRVAELGRGALTEDRLERAMRMPPADRDAQMAVLDVGNAKRRELLRRAAAAYDEMLARKANVGDGSDVAKLAAAAEAEDLYDQAKAAVLATALSAEDVRRLVEMSDVPRRILDDATGDTVELPSERASALRRLEERHPEASAELEEILGLYRVYERQRTTLDDPQDLIRMLRGAGVLTFRITVDPGSIGAEEDRLRRELQSVGPRNVKSTDYHWYKLNKIEGWVNSKRDVDFLADDRNAPEYFRSRGYIVEPYGGEYFMLCWDTRGTRLTPMEGRWGVAKAYPGSDRFGRPAINFAMDPSGSRLLGELTGPNVGKRMAVLLDDQVYTAPTLQSQISASGEITGEFTPKEIQYIVQVLAGGSLQARLSSDPIAINAVGPDLGIDNLRAGVQAALWSILIVAGFMILYYFRCGAIAVVALVANAMCIMGAMALSKAAFTMPGIAGVILTFGMAVDSSVLIYERMREETLRGADLKTSVRLGFDKALSAIVDGNVTNLIVCVVLYYTGTPEIRGFAITMGIGVVSTLFASLVICRLIIDLMVLAGWRRASMLPLAIPALQSAITPTIRWLRYRYVFFVISAIYVGLGLGMVFYQGAKMLDNEFRGGTQVTLQFKPGADGTPHRLTRREVEDRVLAIAQGHAPDSELNQLKTAEIIPIDPQSDGVTSDKFLIKTVATEADTVVGAVVDKFKDLLEVKPALEFTNSQVDLRRAPAYPIEKPALGANIDRPGVRNDVTQYLGGVAIVLDKLNPAPTLDGLRGRLRITRESSQYSDTLIRNYDIIVLDGNDQEVRSAVLLVRDESFSFFDNESSWDRNVREREWSLVQDALTRATTPASVHNFSPTIAKAFQAQAIAATMLSFFFIGVYIWVRFKTPRYSIAAVVALVHDVLTVVGLLALCEILYDHPATSGIARSIGLLPFKIDLNTLAALLTIAGYSLNDTVVIMDRIRENKGKLKHASESIVNESINQTFSRTIITGGTTLASCFILFAIGGEGMRAFAFALGAGLIVGTYSSVAVAAPIVWSTKIEEELRASGAA